MRRASSTWSSTAEDSISLQDGSQLLRAQSRETQRLASADHAMDGTRSQTANTYRLALDGSTRPSRRTTGMATWRLLHNNDLLRLLRLLARLLDRYLLSVRCLLLILIEQVLELLMVQFLLLALRILG